jgi:flagellar secretion chaperone FliS
MNALLNVNAAAAKYRGVQVATYSPLQLLVMLFDGAIRFTTEASTAMSSGDRARAGERIGKAHAIVEELAATLDPTNAPELCENLLALYSFAMRRLVEASLEQDTVKLGEVVIALTPLREGFATLAQQR